MNRLPLAVRVVIIAILGIAFAGSVLSSIAVTRKLRGKGDACSWRRTLLYGFDTLLFSAHEARTSWSLKVKETDSKLNLQRFSTAGRDFWIQRAGAQKDGHMLLQYLLSEQAWMASVNGGDHVQPGDVVLDCGAHVGVFTDLALRRGASRVVAIEPDPMNLECLRRNFAPEIAAGRVILAPLGVWSDERTITLYTGKENSGMNSMIWNQKAGWVEVRVTTIDRLVRELHLPR
ncbi:MAG: FkbM family methyltransferase, partial [Bryobacteraceae bacterium]